MELPQVSIYFKFSSEMFNGTSSQICVEIFWQWEKYEYKIADFQNHRHFSLRCLSKDIIPTSVRLKGNIKTPKGKYIIRKAERALLNERSGQLTIQSPCLTP